MTDNIKRYYNDKFRNDIQKILMSIPEKSRHHHNPDDKMTFTIQYERLSRDFNHLDFLTHQEKVYFGISLFFTVLVDQICYTHYKDEYENFRQLTLYPKFIGNCLTMCHYHYNPKEIFSAMNYSSKKTNDNISHKWFNFRELFIGAIPIMEKETKVFFETNPIKINGNEFWKRCIIEFPY